MKLTTAQAHGPHRARARSAARLVAAPLVAFVLIIASGTAYADVDWHEKGANMSATVSPWKYPEGRPYALAEFLGYDWSSLSNEVRDLIVTDSNGDNAFNQILQHNVSNVQYETDEGALNWPIIGIWSTLFGLDKCWDISVTNERYVAAQDVMKKYMFPNDGDDEEVGDDDEYILGNVVETGPPQESYTMYYTGNRQKINDLDTFVLNLSTSAYNEFVNKYNSINSEYELYCFVDINNGGSGNVKSGDIIIADFPVQFVLSKENGNVVGFRNMGGGGNSFYNYWCNYNISTGEFTLQSNQNWRPHTLSENISGTEHWLYDSADATYVPKEPYNPVPPTNTERPVIQIGDVTIDLSNGPYTVNNTTYSVVYAPDNSWSIQVNTHTDTPYSGDVTASDPTDYTSILNAILQAINRFRTEFNTAYNDIDAQLTTILNTFSTAIKNVETTLNNQLQAMQTQNHQDIQTLQTNLQNNLNGKMDAYTTQLWSNLAAMDQDLLEELFKDAQYIVDNLNFNADFDDSDIVQWLKRIYSRVKDRKVSVPAPDEDPKGWADAIAEFLEKILAMMVTGLDVAQISELFDELKNRFPISIPWDMVALLYLFDGEPVTPEFDWPMYNGDTKVTDLHCDFSDFDDAMTYVRQGELLLFCIGLMYNTKWLMNVQSEVIDHRKG